ncbi:Nuclear receptor 2C2-associated protein [Podochytrium sp. JEL0797]|nr:Nuclear receptor 2C2-associated protein [Podochytrium sp. JEL0797]
MSLLQDPSLCKIKVSSTLNKDSKSFGKQYLIDGSLETCWNSDQGPSQWIILEFSTPTTSTHLSLMFQGGFSASQLRVLISPTSPLPASSNDWIPLTTLYPEDSNKEQVFAVGQDAASSVTARSWKLVFEEPGDTFGRIVLYKLDLRV